MKKYDVVLRCDASPEIGTGHVFRCSTLASSLARLGLTTAMLGIGIRPLEGLLDLHDSVEVLEVADSALQKIPSEIAGDLRSGLVIVDGYHIEKSFFHHLQAENIPYLVFDDNGETQATFPLAVINQNTSSPLPFYDKFPASTIYFLGPRFAQVRASVRSAGLMPAPKGPEDVFVAFGGSDRRGFSLPIVRKLQSTDWTIRVALGGMRHDLDSVSSQLKDTPNVTVVAPERFAEELRKSRCAVLAAGTSVWEAVFLGVEVLPVVAFDNQLKVAQEALRLGLITEFYDAREEGSFKSWSASLRRKLETVMKTPRFEEPRKVRVGEADLAGIILGLIESRG